MNATDAIVALITLVFGSGCFLAGMMHGRGQVEQEQMEAQLWTKPTLAERVPMTEQQRRDLTTGVERF